MYHRSVLLEESVGQLRVENGGIYVDATFGGGGHSKLILEKMGDKGRLLGFDQDEDAQKNAQQEPFSTADNFVFVWSNFRFLKKRLRLEGVFPGEVSGILADLGVSSHQLDTVSRGFSHRFDAPLDMRMQQSAAETAADWLNTRPAAEIQRVLSEWGELRNARTLAQAIVAARQVRALRSTADLVALCDAHSIGERTKYRSQVFQAIRMAVNDEVGTLQDFLRDALEMLMPGGRLVVITFHSVEDRVVKNFMKTGNFEGKWESDFYGNIRRPFEVVLKKPLKPTAAEISNNPRARSAKLRVAIKKI